MRLPTVAVKDKHDTSKIGRIMPSIIRWESTTRPGTTTVDDLPVIVGAPALIFPHQDLPKGSLLQSVKRLLGKRYKTLDPHWIKTLDYDVISTKHYGNNDADHTKDNHHLLDDNNNTTNEEDNENDEEEDILLVARTSREGTIVTTPQEVLAIELNALRKASQIYLDRYQRKKNLQVPGGTSITTTTTTTTTTTRIRNVVVGVPAHFSQRHIRLIKEACRTAGFDGHIGTCLESTAAAMAYGLTMQETLQDATIMVSSTSLGLVVLVVSSCLNRKCHRI
jgi:hypothetical protein